MNDREDLRLHLRDEVFPRGSILLLRGGPDTPSLIRSHARRTNRLYCLDDRPLWGVSMFAALDATGPSSFDGILAGRLASYEVVHVPSAADLVEGDLQLLPSFRRPHYTVAWASDSLDQAEHVLGLLRAPQENPYNREVRRRRQERQR